VRPTTEQARPPSVTRRSEQPIWYRVQQLQTTPTVELLLDNHLSAEDILQTGIEHIFIATGSSWCKDGRGRSHPRGLQLTRDCMPVLTPESLLTANPPSISSKQHIVIYDDDHYFIGGAVAEAMLAKGCNVTLVTPANCVSAWTENTLEQHKIQSHLLAVGVEIVTAHEINKVNSANLQLSCTYSGKQRKLSCDALVVITSRVPHAELYHQLETADNFKSLQLIGDSLAPSTTAAAVYSGHLAARSLAANEEKLLFNRELVEL